MMIVPGDEPQFVVTWHGMWCPWDLTHIDDMEKLVCKATCVKEEHS